MTSRGARPREEVLQQFHALLRTPPKRRSRAPKMKNLAKFLLRVSENVEITIRAAAEPVH